MNKPLISIITVCYNAEATIENTILSVLNQTYDNIEYIIIDGASTDGTLDLIKKYESKFGYWISEPDKGIYDAMNKAVKVAKGDWLFFINSDDVFINNECLQNVAYYLLQPNTVYYGNVIKIPENIKYDGHFSKYKLSHQNICHQSIFYPNMVFKKYSYQIKYKIYADWYLNISLMGDRDIMFKYIDQIITKFNTEGFSSSRNDVCFKKDLDRHIRENFGLICFLYSYLMRKRSFVKSLMLRLIR